MGDVLLKRRGWGRSTGYQYPVGIPAVPSGLEVLQTLPAQPAEWPEAENASAWYIDNSHPSATDTVGAGDSNPRRGYPDKPRLTVPANGTFAAGSRIEIGGPTTMPGDRTYTLNGSSGSRVVLCGAGTVTSTGTSRHLILGGEWFIVDGLTFVNTLVRNPTNVSASHVLCRNCTSRDWTGSDTAAMFDFASTMAAPAVSEDVVYYNLTAYNIGDYSGDVVSDNLGIAAGNGALRWWILNCHFYQIGGDGVRTGTNVGAGSAANRGQTIYIGGCHFHDNGENAVDVKNSMDLVVSQCSMHDFEPAAEAEGEAVVIHEDAQRTLIIACDIYNARSGIMSSSGGQDDVWVVGCNFWNIAHDAEADPTYDATVLDWPGAAVNLRILNGANDIINCTFDDCDRFINIEATSGTVRVVNNIFGTLKGNGSMVGFEGTTPASNAVVTHNLFPAAGGTQARVQVTTSRHATLAAYVSAYAGKGANCVEGDPEFVNAGAGNFTLGATSDAKDVGSADATYATLLSTFGQSMARDRLGVSRPQGEGWDMGAHEAV